MADFINTIKGVDYLGVGRDFDYAKATQNFMGLKLFPMIKTKNFKVVVQQLMDGADLPVIALVHALDSEAKIGDRPNYEEFKAEKFYIKEKLNQGEALRKKLQDSGLDASEKSMLEAIYNDIRNLISRVLARLEAMACEIIATGKATIDENNVKITVDFNVPAKNKMVLSGWATASHSILADLIAVKKLSKNKIVRAITGDKILGYMLANTEIINIATKQGTYPTADWLKTYLMALLKIEIITNDEEYKLSALSDVTFRFFDEDTISFVTTIGELGKTVMTSTPAEDYNLVEYSNANVTIHTEETREPVGIWTIAGAVGLPVLSNAKGLFIVKVGA